MNDDSIFIGIDPGSNKLGFAIIANYFGKVRLVKSGVIVFHKNDSLQKKLLYVFNYRLFHILFLFLFILFFFCLLNNIRMNALL